jgi:hypothetical protein
MAGLILMGLANISIYILVKFILAVFCVYVLGIKPDADTLLIISGVIAVCIALCVSFAWGKSNDC